MATKCDKVHLVKHGNKLVEVPCYFIAGVCVVDPIHEGGLSSFLKATYPYYHSPDYNKSKQMQDTIVSDIQPAHFNVDPNLVR